MIGAATDEALARRAAAGQREAFEELVRRHRSRVFTLALRICRNPDDAEDALQETFIAAHRALPRFDGRARVSTWLYRIATNKCYDIVARRRPTADAAALPEAADPPRSVRPQPAERGAHAGARRTAGAVPRGGAPVRRLRSHAGRGRRGRRRTGGHDEIAQLPRAGAARRCAPGGRRGTDSGRRGLTLVDDSGFEAEVPAEELEAIRRSLAALGERPLPPAVAGRLGVRLAAELDASPLAERRSRRGRLGIGATLSAAAAVAAIAVFALSWGGGGHRPAAAPEAVQSSVAAAVQADSSAKVARAAKQPAPREDVPFG